jgi:hypothetical protein
MVLVPIDNHGDAALGTIQLANVALDAVFRIRDYRPLRCLVPAEHVYEAGFEAGLATAAAF